MTIWQMFKMICSTVELLVKKCLICFLVLYVEKWISHCLYNSLLKKTNLCKLSMSMQGMIRHFVKKLSKRQPFSGSGQVMYHPIYVSCSNTDFDVFVKNYTFRKGLESWIS